MEFKVFDSSEGNVSKYVFTGDDFVAESVIYKYPDYKTRTVICCSTMSGCPVGCSFCGTGKKFVRNLTSDEIVEQILTVLKDKSITYTKEIERFQIMFMSMGEPLLNMNNVGAAIEVLNHRYPNAELLISTIGPKNKRTWDEFFILSNSIDKIGLQFSIHKSTDEKRNRLIPYTDKLDLRSIRDIGILWSKSTGRPVFLNYCIDGTNNTLEDAENLMNLFPLFFFNFTFSVVCSKNENMKEAGFKNLDKIREFENIFIKNGYNTRVFNPAGQDDIGGGCGQLWYVQKWMKGHNIKNNLNIVRNE
nr:MAG TPA: putative Fe-S-cluster redox enzyme [Caudoviricetes sp.]